MDSLFKKIIKFSLVEQTYIPLKRNEKNTVYVRATHDKRGIVIFVKEKRDFVPSPIEPVVERLIIRYEGDFINSKHPLIQVLKENKKEVEKAYKELPEDIKNKNLSDLIKTKDEDKLKNFIWTDDNLIELASKIAIEETFIDVYSQLGFYFKEYLENAVVKDEKTKNVRAYVEDYKVILENKKLKVILSLNSKHLIEDIEVKAKEEMLKKDIKELFELVLYKNKKLEEDALEYSITLKEMLLYHDDFYEAAKNLIKEFRPIFNKIQNKTSFVQSYLKVGNLRCISLHDMVDQIELDLGYKNGEIMFMLNDDFSIKWFLINHFFSKSDAKSIEDIVSKANMMKKVTKDYEEVIKMKDEVERRIDYILKLEFAGSHEKFKEIQEKEGSYKDRILTPYKVLKGEEIRDLVEKIIEYTTIKKEPMLIEKTEYEIFYGMSTIDGNGIILYTKPTTKFYEKYPNDVFTYRKLKINKEDNIDYSDLYEKLIKNRNLIEKEYNKFKEIKEKKEERLKQFILIDRKMEALVSEVVLTELFIDKYSKLAKPFEDSLSDKVKWDYEIRNLRTSCYENTVFLSNEDFSLKIKLEVYENKIEINDLVVEVKRMGLEEEDLEDFIKKIKKKNIGIYNSFCISEIRKFVNSYLDLIPTIEYFFKETITYLEEMKKADDFSSIFWKNNQKIDQINLNDNVNSLYIDLFVSRLNLLRIITDDNFKLIDFKILKTERGFYHKEDRETLNLATDFLKSIDIYILDLLREKEIIKEALQERGYC